MARQATKRRQTTDAHDEKRNDILNGCATLFDKVGYHRASMQMLADEVGLGKPTLYHYFASKNAILFAMHDAHMSALLSGLESEDAGGDPHKRLRAACIDILRQIAEHPGYVRAFMDHYEDLEGTMRNQIRAQRNAYFQQVRGIIRQGIEDKFFRPCDPDLTTFGFLGMCNWAYKWYPPMAKKKSPDEVADALCGSFFQGLTQPQP